MIVYLLTDQEWDSETPQGIYSTFQQAADASAAARLGSSGMIYEYHLDNTPGEGDRQWYCSLGGQWIECSRKASQIGLMNKE